MRKILIIGIGAGNPDFLTLQAIKALNRADVFFIPDKGGEKAALRQLRIDICDRFVERRPYRSVDVPLPERTKAPADYPAAVGEWHAAIAARYQALFLNELDDGQCGGFLVWGDPTLYDSTLRIVEAIQAGGFPLEYEIIPGISSVQVLAAAHRTALNRIGEPVLLTTGRKLEARLPEGTSTVVLLDGEQAFARIADEDAEIVWGAYLGTPDEILISGRLSEVKEEIRAVRARAKRDKGWIMDTYLLRRADGDRSLSRQAGIGAKQSHED